MVCVNLHNSANICRHINFDTAKNFSTVYHSMLDKSYDTFVSAEKSPKLNSNPILEAVKKAVPMVKEPRVQIAEDLHGLILDTSHKKTDAIGKDALVFSVPNHSDLVLRVEKTALDKMDKLPKDLELVPIAYDSAITQNKHLGLPLYFVTSKSSTIARKNSISALEAFAQQYKIMVLRKVTGEHPANECGERLLSMMGFDDFKNPDVDMLNNFSFLYGYVKGNYGQPAAVKCLEMFKNGVSEIPANALGEGSAPFEVVKGKEFYQKYKVFSESYVKSLKDTADIPQQSYDDAVGFIVSSKNFHIDFQHTNNTFVDMQKQEFNFMDFAYDKKDPKYTYKNPVKEFRDVIFGKNFRSLDSFADFVPFMPKFKTPRAFIVEPEDAQGVVKYSQIINEKVNSASPERFRSEKFFM